MSYVIRQGKRIAVETITGPAPVRRRSPAFILTTQAQSDRLDEVAHFAAEKIFRHVQLLAFKAWGNPVRLGNAALERKGVSRGAKREALRELERVGLIQVTRCQHHAPDVVILDLECGGDVQD